MLRVYCATPVSSRADWKAVALKACAVVLKAGHSPIAPHLAIAQVLDDSVPEDRSFGMACCKLWIPQADELWAWGCSAGVRSEVEVAESMGVLVRYRSMIELDGRWRWLETRTR